MVYLSFCRLAIFWVSHKVDRIYTPTDFARKLAHSAAGSCPSTIADFAVGDGALLAAALERWPLARLHGFDIDQGALENLGSRFPGMEVAQVDFLEASARLECNALVALLGKCDLVLLNPPFSSRGRKSVKTEFMGTIHQCSKAFAFLVRSLDYLSVKGELIAIIPKSCLTSQLDRAICKSVIEQFSLEQIGHEHKSIFRGHAVSVLIVKARRLKGTQKAPDIFNSAGLKPEYQEEFSVKVLRGTFPVHSYSRRLGSFPLVHTTELKNGEIVGEKARVINWSRSVSGRSLLLPRVGKPDRRKLVLKSTSDCIVISDCIYALATSPCGFEVKLFDKIFESWGHLEDLYYGSCAPYLTLESLKHFLASLGFRSNAVSCINADVIDTDCVSSEKSENELSARWESGQRSISG